MNKKYLLALALVAVMVISVLPLVASDSNAATKSVTNDPVDVSWQRSGDAQYNVIDDSIWGPSLATIYQQSDMEMTASWSALDSISATISGKNAAGDNLVWDGSNPIGGFHYTTEHLGNTYTTYPTATIKGEGTVRFTGTFSLSSLLSAGTDITNLKVGINPYTTTSGQVALNDQMFVFIYPKGTTLSDNQADDNYFMNYYVFGAGYESLAAWLGNADSVETFNGVPMVHTFRDPAYYAGGNQEGTDYKTYGAELTALGYTQWSDTEGWFGHGLTYLYQSDIDSSNFSSVDQLYLSDGLFFMNNAPQTVLDLSSYGGAIPSDWIIDVFAVNTDAVGGIAQPQVFVNYDENTFGKDTGQLEIGKAYGDSYNVSGSITSGDPKDLYLDSKGKTDHSKNTHDLGTAVAENGNNWFEYNVFNGIGGSGRLVQGDKLTDVGGYSIVANGDGTFTITMDGDTYAVGAQVSISNNFIQGGKNANTISKDKTLSQYVLPDGTITAIWTSSPGQQQFSGKQLVGDGNSFTITAPWVDTSKPYYVYIHLDGITGYVNTSGFGPDKTFTVNVQGPSYPDGQDFQVLMNGTLPIKDLIPGTYLIKENEAGFSPDFYVGGVKVQSGGTYTIQVLADQTAKVLLKNKPITDIPTSEIMVKKTVQTLTGFDVGAGFKFNIYRDADQTSYVGFLVTGDNGVGTFIANGIDVGTVFYLFEDMNNVQSALFEPQTGYIEVTSVPVTYDPRPDVNVTNYFLPAGFTVEKQVQQRDDPGSYLLAGDDFAFAAYAALDDQGNPVGDPIQTVTTTGGLAVFGASKDYIPGQNYYVIETSCPDNYKAFDGVLIVTATVGGAKDGAATFAIQDELIPAGFTVEKQVQQRDGTTYLTATGGGFFFSAYASEADAENGVNAIETVETASGLAAFGPSLNYEIGTKYFVKETACPPEYYLSGDIISVTATVSGDPDAATYVVKDNLIPAGFNVVKLIQQRSLTMPYTMAGEGFTFTSYSMDDEGNLVPIEDASTNNHGVAVFPVSLNYVLGGTYYVMETNCPTEYSLSDKVTSVKATANGMTGGATATVTDDLIPGTFAVQKMVEQRDGKYLAEPGFVFTAYTDVKDGMPAGSQVGIAVSGHNGVATFLPSIFIEPGTTYYVFESMNLLQSAVYTSADPGYVEVVATAFDPDAAPAPVTFSNDLIPGGFTIEKQLEQRDGSTYLTATNETFTFNVYASLPDARADRNAIDTQSTVNGLATFGPSINYQLGKTYYVKETVAADGYYLNGNIFSVTATAGGADANTFVVKDNLIPAGFSVAKMVQNENSTYDLATGVFSFSAYATVDDGMLGVNSIQTVSTENGVATFNASLLYEIGGTYYVFENMTTDQDSTYVANNDGLSYIQVQATAKGVAADPFEFDNDLALGSLTVSKEIVTGDYDCSSQEFSFTVIGPQFSANFDLKGGESKTLSGLIPGNYTVTEDAVTGWAATYSVADGKVTVVANDEAQVEVTNTLMAGFSVQKMVELADGTYAKGGEGFTFEVYASPDDFGDATKMIESKTTGSDGIATFGPSTNYVPGTEYYVREVMTGEQLKVYTADTPYIVVVAGVSGGSVSQQTSYTKVQTTVPDGLWNGSSDPWSARIAYYAGIPACILRDNGDGTYTVYTDYYYPTNMTQTDNPFADMGYNITSIEEANVTAYPLQLNIDGTWSMSFCGHILTSGYGENYSLSALTDQQTQLLIAALDYVNDNYGFNVYATDPGHGTIIDPKDCGSAVAQFLVWRIAEPDIVSACAGWDWDTGALSIDSINWILDNCLSIYEQKMANLAPGQEYVSDVQFYESSNTLSQPQVVPIFSTNSGGYEFKNDLIPAGFSVIKFVQQRSIIPYTLAGEGFTFTSYYKNDEGTYVPIESVPTNAHGVATFDVSLKYVPGGTYYVKETSCPPEYYCSDNYTQVTAAANGTAGGATATVTDDLIPGTFAVQKMVEQRDGKYLAEPGFVFTAYADVKDGKPVGLPVGIAVSGNNGVATFLPSVYIEPGTTYYVFENMNLLQSAVYTAADPGYVEVVATAYNPDAAPEAVPFDNSLIPGGFTIEKQLEQRDGSTYLTATNETFTFNVYASLPDARADRNAIDTQSTVNGLATFGPSINYQLGKTYYVKEIGAADGYYLNGNIFSVTATAGGADANTFVVKDNLIPAGFSVAKMVQNENGTYDLATGVFSFSAYATVDDGMLGVNSIQTVSTENGVATFNASLLYEIGGTYYVFENMTTDQDSTYVANNDGLSYIQVQATAGGVAADPFEFDNDLATGSLTVSASVDYQYNIQHYVPNTYETFPTDGTLISWVGYGDNGVPTDPSIDDHLDHISGYFVNNGFTYLGINLAYLMSFGDAGVNIGIAQSDQAGGSHINGAYNVEFGDFTHYFYNIKSLDGKTIVVTCEVLTGGHGGEDGFAIAMSSSPWSGNPNGDATGHFFNAKNPYTGTIPKTDANGDFYFFFHIQSGSTMLNFDKDGNRIVETWKLVSTETVTEQFYGNVGIVVSDANGQLVASGPLPEVTANNIKSGWYTVDLMVNGEQMDTFPVFVDAGGSTTFEFAPLTIIGPTVYDPTDANPSAP